MPWALWDELCLERVSRWARKEKEVGSKEKDVKFQIPASSAHSLFFIALNLHAQPKAKISGVESGGADVP